MGGWVGGWVGGKVNRKVEVDFWGRCGGGGGKNVECGKRNGGDGVGIPHS